MITLEQAYKMGQTGGEVVEHERALFEEWMRGHCWAVTAEWNGKEYRGTSEVGGAVCPHAMQVRMLWAVWRDRAALAKQMESKHKDEIANLKKQLNHGGIPEPMSELLERAQIAERERDLLKEQIKHSKANHDNVVMRLRIATQRPDLPVDRLPVMQEVQKLWEKLCTIEAEFKGADGFENWKEAAISERQRRITAEEFVSQSVGKGIAPEVAGWFSSTINQVMFDVAAKVRTGQTEAIYTFTLNEMEYIAQLMRAAIAVQQPLTQPVEPKAFGYMRRYVIDRLESGELSAMCTITAKPLPAHGVDVAIYTSQPAKIVT